MPPASRTPGSSSSEVGVTDATPAYREVARYRPGPFWLLIAFSFFFAWYVFVQRIVLGRPYAIETVADWVVWAGAAVCGVLIPAFFLSLRLMIEVDEDYLTVGFWPLRRRRIRLADVRNAEEAEFNAPREFGGFGYRFDPKRKMVLYATHGNRGVAVEVGVEKVLVGTERPGELIAAVRAGRR